MDTVKEIIVAYFQRIRTPVLGSIILAFIAVNWKVIYFVLFADVEPEIKFEYWDKNTDQNTLYFIPAWIGAGIAIGGPFLSLLATHLITWPISEVRLLTQENAYKIALKKADHQQQMNEYKQALLDAKLEQQETYKKLDEDAKQEVKADVEALGTGLTASEILLQYSTDNEKSSEVDDETRWKYMEMKEVAATEHDWSFFLRVSNFRTEEGAADPYEVNNMVDRLLEKIDNTNNYLKQNSESPVKDQIIAEMVKYSSHLKSIYSSIDYTIKPIQ